jgi:hypothetical protein
MLINLSSYYNIRNNLYVKFTLPNNTAFRISDNTESYTLFDEVYAPSGDFLTITPTTSDLSNPQNDVTVTLSGIPDSNLSTFLNQKVKGTKIQIWRVITPKNASAIVSGRFTGYIMNYSVTEEFDVQSRLSKNTIGLICSTILSIMAKTTKGRKTNPTDFANETSMDRVPTLVGAYFDFGAPQ